MTGIINSGLDGLTTVRTSTDGYSANDGELIITDARSVDLPDPTVNANAVILVKPVGSDIRLNTPVGHIANQSNNKARYNGRDALWLQSDGNNWYVRSDLEDVRSVIPDSVVNNLLFRYKYENDSDTTTAIDESDNNNDGTINGATYSATTEFGDFALSFGGDDYVDAPVIFNQNSFTIMGWVNKDNTDSGQYIIDTEADRTGIDYERQVSSGFGFYMYDGSSYTTISSGNTTTGSWVLVAARWDKTANEMKFWTGGLTSSITSHGTAAFSSSGTNDGETALGSVSKGDRNFFVGRQEEMVVCDAVIPESDIEKWRQALI